MTLNVSEVELEHYDPLHAARGCLVIGPLIAVGMWAVILSLWMTLA